MTGLAMRPPCNSGIHSGWLIVQALFLTGVLGLSAGCGSAPTASGNVTYDGNPVEDGYITFFPDEKGSSQAAAPIKNGAYEATFAKPGAYLVEITGRKKIAFAMSTEEMERKWKEAKAKGNTTGIIESAEAVPPNAKGNRQKVTIASGSQSLDFHLKKP